MANARAGARRYEVYDGRLTVYQGKRILAEYPLHHFHSVRIIRNPLDYLLGTSTLQLVGSASVEIPQLHDAAAYQEVLAELIAQAQREKRHETRDRYALSPCVTHAATQFARPAMRIQ